MWRMERVTSVSRENKVVTQSSALSERFVCAAVQISGYNACINAQTSEKTIEVSVLKSAVAFFGEHKIRYLRLKLLDNGSACATLCQSGVPMAQATLPKRR